MSLPCGRWVDVKVDDTGDGLIIAEDDLIQHDLEHDVRYQGRLITPGKMRIFVLYRIRKEVHHD